LERVLIMIYSEIREDFLEKLEKRLEEIKVEVEKMKADMEDAAEDRKAEMSEKIEMLQEKHEFATRRMEEFKEVPEVIWGGMMDEVEEFWQKIT